MCHTLWHVKNQTVTAHALIELSNQGRRQTLAR